MELSSSSYVSADKNSLVQQFASYVGGIARQIKKNLSSNIDIDDLIGYGMAGLLEAAERYDPKRGANFTTFSYYRIRGAIYDGLRGMGWLSRVEYQKIQYEERANRYLENITSRQIYGDGKQTDDLAVLSNQVNQLVTIYITSLDGLSDAELGDGAAVAQDERVIKQELSGILADALAQLPDDDRELIDLYYFRDMNLENAGKQLGLSKSWTCRKHAQSIEKLSDIIQSVLQDQSMAKPKKRKTTLSDICR